MIKAIYFDWSNTLASYNPPREELYQKVFREFGFLLALKPICRGLAAGDEYFLSHNSRYLERGKRFDEQIRLFICYAKSIFSEAGIDAPYETQSSIMQRVMSEYTNELILFEEVKPLFKSLKELQITLGIITNADRRVETLINKLGLMPYLDTIMTSEEAGVEKPNPRIFEVALAKDKIKAGEAIYIGDQYKTDIVGASRVGMTAILIDRYDIYTELHNCIRIRTLSEVRDYIK